MALCEVCGNDYDKTLSVTVAGGKRYCCAHCARHSGEKALRDRA